MSTEVVLRPLTAEQKRILEGSTVVPRLAGRISKRQSVLDYGELKSIGHVKETELVLVFNPKLGTPFEGFTFIPVRREMWGAVYEERKRTKREMSGMLDAGYEVLDRAPSDPGDGLRDSEEETKRQIVCLVSTVFATVAGRYLSPATHLPMDESTAVERADRERKIAWLRGMLVKLGDEARVLELRYLEGLEWKEVAARLDCAEYTAMERHDRVCLKLASTFVRRLAK